MCGTTTHLAKGTLRPLLDTPAHGAVEASSLPSTTQSYRRLIPRQRRRMTSPLRHLPMSERAAVRSQIRRASKLPRYPQWPCHGDNVCGRAQRDTFSGTMSSRPGRELSRSPSLEPSHRPKSLQRPLETSTNRAPVGRHPLENRSTKLWVACINRYPAVLTMDTLFSCRAKIQVFASA